MAGSGDREEDRDRLRSTFLLCARLDLEREAERDLFRRPLFLLARLEPELEERRGIANEALRNRRGLEAPNFEPTVNQGGCAFAETL